jgi:hypothetical protein
MLNKIGLNTVRCEENIENVDYFLNKKYNQHFFKSEIL